jgi:glycerophosphoryl diester phosphodiesterase
VNVLIDQLLGIFVFFRANWRQFLVIHAVVSAIVFILLAPLAALSLHLAVALSGDAALSDQDILFFLMKPTGLISLLIVASAFSIVIFLEHAALLAVAWYSEENWPVTSVWLLRLLGRRSAALFGLAARILLRILLTLFPFLLLLLVVYTSLLSEYDINFYLSRKPPEFLQAVVMGGLIVIALVFVLMRQFIGWVFCLPLLLINGLSPVQAMSRSREAVMGQRLQIGAWLAAWLVSSLLVAAAITGLMGLAGNLLVPFAVASFRKLLLVLSMLSLLAAVLNFALTWISNSILSILIVVLFKARGIGQNVNTPPGEGDVRFLVRFFSRRNLVWALVAGIVISVLTVNGLLGRVLMEDRTEIMAHRGASAMAPENTIAAVRAAIAAGAHWVEIDVQETVDGEIVVIHDSDLKKIAGQPIKIAESTLAELQSYDIGSWFDPGFSDQRIPTLQQILELCKDRIGVNIELKYYGGERRLEESVAEITEAAGMQNQVLVMSLSYSGIQRMRELRPGWTLGLLSSVAVGKLIELDIDFLALNARSASAARIRKTQDRAKRLMVWTVNDAPGMSSMISRGADVIITDEPALALSVLKQRTNLEPAQRFLLYLADIFDQPSLIQEQ